MRHHIVQVAEQPVGSTVSIGIGLFPEYGTTVEVVPTHADLALYQAKIRGRDAYCVYTPGLKT